MAKGGHARSGPAPDPNALRRERDGDGWVTLPAVGRQGAPPEWPLEHVSERERKQWAREWARPQAIMWERNGQEDEVALYVRAFVEASAPGANTNSRTLVRQLQEALGLSVPGLARNKWRIEAPQEAAPTRRAAGRSVRERFTVVTGDGGA
jgi:hypothetical protein